VEISNDGDTETEHYDSEYEAASCFAECLQNTLAYTDNPFHRSGTVISIRKDGETILEYALPLDRPPCSS